MAGLALHEAGVEVEPVAGDVDRHAQLEEEHAGRVEGGQRRQQTHRRTPNKITLFIF